MLIGWAVKELFGTEPGDRRGRPVRAATVDWGWTYLRARELAGCRTAVPLLQSQDRLNPRWSGVFSRARPQPTGAVCAASVRLALEPMIKRQISPTESHDRLSESSRDGVGSAVIEFVQNAGARLEGALTPDCGGRGYGIKIPFFSPMALTQ